MNDPTPCRHLAHMPPFQSQPIVFITVATFQRRKHLAADGVHAELHGVWDRSSTNNGWFVGDYVVMPDHVHLFARAAMDADPLAQWVKMWKSVSARALIRIGVTSSPVWQEDYFDRFLRNAESYADKWSYVRMNPVRAGLVAEPAEWRFQGRIHALAV